MPTSAAVSGPLCAGRRPCPTSRSAPGARGVAGSPVTAPCLCCRFPRLHSAVIRTFVLVQHYAAAMMAVSGLSQMKDYTSVETLEITQNLINAPKQCPCGHGLMVLLRVPCSPLAAVAYERLAHVRARLALEEHFEIILGNPSSGITVGKHFVKQLKVGAGGRDGRGGRCLGEWGAGWPRGGGVTGWRQTPQGCCPSRPLHAWPPLWPPLLSWSHLQYQITYKYCPPPPKCLVLLFFFL